MMLRPRYQTVARALEACGVTAPNTNLGSLFSARYIYTPNNRFERSRSDAAKPTLTTDGLGSEVIGHIAMQQRTNRSDVIVSDMAGCGHQSIPVLRRGLQRNSAASVRLVGAPLGVPMQVQISLPNCRPPPRKHVRSALDPLEVGGPHANGCLGNRPPRHRLAAGDGLDDCAAPVARGQRWCTAERTLADHPKPLDRCPPCQGARRHRTGGGRGLSAAHRSAAPSRCRISPTSSVYNV